MRATLIPIGLTCLCVSLARADYNPVPLTPGSFNADVVVEKTAAPPLQAFATATLDSGTNNTGYTFYEQGYANFPLAGAARATGVPAAGTTFAAASDANHTFRMPSDYAANNALLLGPYAGYTTGTLTLTAPAPYTTLSVLATAGNGPENNNVTIHYEGGGSQTVTLPINDWYNSTPVAWYANGRVSVSGGNLDNGALSTLTDANPRLLYFDISLSDTVNKVTSIDFAYTSGGRAGVFGLSGSTDGTTFTPLAVTGFDRDMIVEATAPKSNWTPTASVTLDGGPAVTGYTFYETGFNGNTDGLPHPGANVVFGNHTWTMAPSYTANNCVFVGSYTGLTSGTVTVNAAAAFSDLSFLTASGNGPTSISVTVTHSGGGTETFTISSIDWGNSSSVAYTVTGRLRPTDMNRGTTFYLHNADITLSDTVNPVTSIDFTWVSTGRAVIYAVAGKSPSGSTFDPVAVSGFNADGIIERGATPLAPLYTATTASMDGGTNNTANTWYEQGYYPTYPNSGLPAAGSTITSASLSDHHYQMPASYAANNVVYVDAAHRNANLTIVTPQPLSALSFLSACANGWVSNACIMQYLDGTSETNYFVSLDWFNSSPVAFYANGRVNLNQRLLNNVTVTPGNPRLYEAQFALGNTGSPVTNVALQFLSAQNATAGRMVVLAVSGTAGAVAPIIAVGTPASPPLMLEGTNVVLTAQITGGTAPITYTWYYSGDNGATWSVVTDGGFISGATTASLTNSNGSFANAGLYELVAQNVAGSVTSRVATVTMLSGLPNVTVPGDPIVAYAPNGGSTPGAEGVEHAIDGNTSKYLNFAAGTTPFVGPVGFVVTPTLGKTIVSVLRFYTANDTEGRDPADYTLEGSNDGGATWTTISSGPLALPAGRNAGGAALNPLTQFLQEVRFSNATGYTSYRVSCLTIKDTAGISLMQIGEVGLLGVPMPQAPIITLEPVPNVNTFVGSSPTFNVVAVGYPTNLAYQWYLYGTNPIAGATSASYTLVNAQLADSGKTFSCIVTNSVGSTPSTSSTLTVIAAPTSAYSTAVMQDSPMAYFRLDEGPDDGNGNNLVVAYDRWGGHNGIYTNVTLTQPGYSPLDSDTATLFGFTGGATVVDTMDSAVEQIPGIDFARPTNNNVALSVEAWAMLDPRVVALQSDAGIVTKGYGGGGEQFNLDCGGPARAFRFFVRDAAGGVHASTSSVVPDPGGWHHLVGVFDEANSNVVLYVDGLASPAGTAVPYAGLLSSTYPVSIGARAQNASTYYNMVFYGDVDEVAIYSHALSSNQVLAHFYAAGIAPRFVAQPTDTTVSEGGTANFSAPAYGTPTLYGQWYQSANGAPFAPLGGQTAMTLSLSNVPASADGYQYYLQVTNAYGATNSAVATLHVRFGAPSLMSDVPSSVLVYAGRTLSLQAQFAGSPPITYQWYHNGTPLANGGRISGALSNVLTIVNALTNDIGSYQLVAQNTLIGATASSGTATVSVETIPDFNTTGVGWTIQQSGGGTRGIAGDVLTLTDGAGSEATSAFYNYPLYIGAFAASFTYQDVGGGGADGMAFVLQNDPRGPAALGGGGGGLGLLGITPSAALTFNIYASASGGRGMSFGVNGAQGLPYQSTSPVDISSGRRIQVRIVYGNGNAQVTLTDLAFALSYTTSLAVNLPAILGADTAYVGMTGADGGTVSTQTVSDFAFMPLPLLSAQMTSTNTILLSWPSSIGGYALLQKTSVASGGWAPSSAVVNVVGGQYQAVVSPSGGAQFYRLVLQPIEP